MLQYLKFSIFILGLAPNVVAVGTPFGKGSATTGGGSAAAATPTSLDELVTWLGDSTARTIVLTSVFDFTDYAGTTTGAGCKPWTCSPNPQLAIDANDWCEEDEPSAATTTITYYAAGPNPIKVASNKSLIGSGNNAGLKGIGLKITGGTNIIIQNIKITNINPEYVWGGDALQIDGGSNIWIDHNFFQYIGRQMIVTGYGGVSQTTMSNNVFDGQATYSATCNGQHYWAVYLTGGGDDITFAYNYFYMTSGRGPKVGGNSGYYQDIHMYNNYFVSVEGHSLDAGVGSKVLAEGNYFNTVTTPILADSGQVFLPTTSAQAASCESVLGRSCILNAAISSGSITLGTDATTLNGFSSSIAGAASPMAASAVGAYVQANAGVGIIN